MSNVIHWFRQDLRLSDNPALFEAASRGTVIPIYILDDEAAAQDAIGAASRVWLHHSLTKLNASLEGKLRVYRGGAKEILQKLINQYKIEAVHWNRCYEPWRIHRDTQLKAWLEDEGVAAKSYNASLLWEPWEVKKADGTPYRVFTPFYRKGCLNAPPPRQPLAAPDLRLMKENETSLETLELLPAIGWDEGVISYWDVGELPAQQRLQEFSEHELSEYAQGRNYPARAHISRLSPHLHFGEISPHQAWWKVQNQDENSATFRTELAWREFSYALLYHFPELRRKNWNSKFDPFPWTSDSAALQSWQKGQTGFPLIDAGMRELWQTGYMHNRVRMVVASFLVKNLRINWREGEAWFWDCLLDADHASNAASWQWVAGSGADAAPYFRIFNPVTQSEKFDPKGDYIRKWVPELSALSDKSIHAPWNVKQSELELAGIILGQTYPEPIADLKTSRELALDAYRHLGATESPASTDN